MNVLLMKIEDRWKLGIVGAVLRAVFRINPPDWAQNELFSVFL